MSTSAHAERIRAAASRTQPVLSAESCARLARYVDALLDRNRATNLTAARSFEQVLEVLIGPSLLVGGAWPDTGEPRRILDLGTGNGFPGVVAALFWPAAEVLLVERRARKADAVADCLRAADLGNARVVTCDARELARFEAACLGGVDLLTVRAVGPLGATTRIAAPLLAPGGRIVHWKVRDLDPAEHAEGERVAHANDLRLLVDPALEHGGTRLVIYAAREARA